LLVDDSYNANPGSLNAAIDTLASAPGERWLVLGDMRELGVDAEALHAEAGRRAKTAGITRLLTLGPLSAAASAAFGAGATHFDTHAAVAEAIRAGLHPQLRVLVKGSRGSAMDRVVKALLDMAGTQGSATPGGMHAA
jgi:UDP-N-acetylmuramoyl-tripeptide--D-alanyl-D-alanine ligase